MQISKVLRKGDYLLFLLFVAVAAVIAAAPLLWPAGSARRVRITCSGREYGIYSLNEDQEIEIDQNGNTNIVVIRDGHVHMDYSSCRNQVCVDTGSVSRTGETIVCLPNRVIVEILGDGKGGEDEEAIDAIVK